MRDELDRDIVRLAAAAGSFIERGSDALLDGDISAVEELVQGSREFAELAAAVEARVFGLLLRHRGEDDVRRLTAALRVAVELARVGSLMVNVATCARRLFPRSIDPRARGLIQRMREQAALQLRTAVRAWVEVDAVLAAALPDMDDVMDDLQKDLLRWVLALPADEDGMYAAVQLSLVARYYERIADHAVNVARRAQHVMRATQAPHREFL